MRLAAVFLLVMAVGARAEFTLYVSAGAGGGGNGEKTAPYGTLTEARDAIRSARKAGTLKSGDAVTVIVGEGNYPLSESFALTGEDGGTADALVVYRAAKPGKARLRGGVLLGADGFKRVTDEAVLGRLETNARPHVLVCDLSGVLPGRIEQLRAAYRGVPSAPWLYCGGAPMTLARWPNADAANQGWAGFSKAVDTGRAQPDAADPALRKSHPGSFVFDDPRPARWKLADGVWLEGYWTHDWCDETIRVAAYDATKKVIMLAAPHNYGIASGTWGAKQRRFYALNVLDELDAPGEWYLDRERKRLYFYPARSLDSMNPIVLATLTSPLLRLNGVRHVKFAGLAFEYGHADAISTHDVEGVEFAGCEVSNIAGSGIGIDGSRCTVRSCDLFNLGKAGISLNGGDRKSLTRANNLAVNNHVHHYGLFQRTYAPGFGVHGCGQTVRNNCIHDAPHNAVLYGGNEHLLELNEVYRVVLETGDAGAFYTGRDWTSRGNVLRHNYVHDLGGGDAAHVNTMGVYLDDCDCGDTIEGNVFFRAGRAIMIGGGRDNPVLNNLVVNCPIGLHIDARGMKWKQWNNPDEPSWQLEEKAKRMNYTQPPWSEAYPRLAAIMQEDPRQPLNNPVCRNVFVDCSKRVCDFDGEVRGLLDKLTLADNLAVNTRGSKGVATSGGMKGFRDLTGTADAPVELGFRDAAAGDFRLREGSRLLKELPVFAPIPFDRIGLLHDEYRTTR